MREYTEALTHYLHRLFETSYVKMLLAGVLWCIHVLFGPTLRPAIIALVALCFLDFVAGTIKAWLNPRDRIHSLKIRVSLLKILLYAIIVATGHQLHVLGGPIVGAFSRGFLEGMIGGTEALSIFENLLDISRYMGREWHWLSKLMAVIRGRQEAAIANLEKFKEDP